MSSRMILELNWVPVHVARMLLELKWGPVYVDTNDVRA